MPDSRVTLVWFRRDLRLADNSALAEAVRRGGAVIPIFIHAPDEEGPWPPGAASRWWLHQSLSRLDAELLEHGSRLVIRRGSSLRVLRELLKETGATAVHWNRLYEPAARERDARVHSALIRAGVEAESANGSLLFDPEGIRTESGRPYQVFTAFWKHCLREPEPGRPLRTPSTIPVPSRWPMSLPLESLGLEPKVDWAGGIREAWTAGETGARERLRRFVREAMGDYSTARNQPGREGTSRLSPHLHFGEISPRQVWHAVRGRLSRANAQSVNRYCAELGWREFAHSLLVHFPHTPEQPLQRKFAAFPWREDPIGFRAWTRGRTGFPIVDAGMRELWHTGWMHNRVRMIVASFLVKDLLISWRKGAEWFQDTLVDADLANNTLGWQWTAGCGADAAPYFRVFNPTLQGRKFDPHGQYIRRWVPELADVPDDRIHEPWTASADLFAGLGRAKDYPKPIVDHAQARSRALAAFQSLAKNGSTAD